MVTKFDPRIRGLKQRVLKHWGTVLKDDKCKQVFKTRPIIAYQKHKSITDMLISSRI